MKIKVIIILTCAIKFVAANYCDRRFDDNWENELEFWGKEICSARNTKSINFYVILRNERRVTLEFFDSLIRRVRKSCSAVITLKRDGSYNDNRSDNGWSLIRNSKRGSKDDTIASEEKRKNSSKKAEKTKKFHYTDAWETNVIFLSNDNDFDEVFDYEISADWNPLQNFLLLSFWRHEENLEGSKLSKIEKVLKSFWFRRSIQSVFLSVLFSEEERTIHTYNPFARLTDSEWGKMERVEMKGEEEPVLSLLSGLTRRRTKNLNGYKLNVGMFESFLTVQKVKESPVPGSVYEYSAGYDGSDGVTLGTIARDMNFTVKIVEPSDGLTFGTLLENGTYVGTMGDLVYGRVNVSFVSYFVKIYGKGKGKVNSFDFSSAVEYDKVCIVVPRALRIPKWLRIFHIFSPSIWLYSVFFQILMYTSWYYIRMYSPNSSGKMDLETTVLQGVLVNSGYPIKLPESNPERILLAGFFLSSVTTMGILCGSLYTSFAKGMRYKNIDTLQELNDSSLPISYTTYGLGEIFAAPGDLDPASPIMLSLKKKLLYNSNSVIQAASYRNTTGIMRLRHFKLMKEELVDKSGTYLIHVIKECPAQYYFAYLLPKHSVLRERMNVVIESINQAGLSTVWNERNIKHGILVRKIARKAKYARRKGIFFAFRLKDTQTSFYTLSIGLAIATVVFFYEKGCFGCLSCVLEWKKGKEGFGRIRRKKTKDLRRIEKNKIIIIPSNYELVYNQYE